MTIVDLAPLAAFVERRIGLRLEGPLANHLTATLRAALRRSGSPDPAAYVSRLRRDPAAFEALVSELTVGETYFFRGPAQWDLLRGQVLPELDRRGGRRLRTWSAGCATGEEPYTLAMVVEEAGLGERCDILGTDLSRRALAKAAEAVYGEWSLRGVDRRVRQRHFRPAPGGLRVADRLAGRVRLRPLNLVQDPYPEPGIDLVLCRNVLLYLTAEQVGRVARRLATTLRPGGWLFTAPADPPLDAEGALERVVGSAGVAYRRREDVPAPTGSGATATRPRAAQAVGKPPAFGQTPLASAGAGLARAGQAVADADYGGAEAIARRQLAVGSDTASVRAALVRALADAGRIAEADQASEEAATRFPLDAELRCLRALVLLEGGRCAEAVKMAAAAVYLSPDLPMAHLVHGRAQLAKGGAPAARQAFRRARTQLQAMPEDAVVPLSDGGRAGRLAAVAWAYEQRAEGLEARR